MQRRIYDAHESSERLRDRIAAIERERDEARAEIERMNLLASSVAGIVAKQQAMVEVIKEVCEALTAVCKPLGDETETSGNPCTSPNPEQGRAIFKTFAKPKHFLK